LCLVKKITPVNAQKHIQPIPEAPRMIILYTLIRIREPMQKADAIAMQAQEAIWAGIIA